MAKVETSHWVCDVCKTRTARVKEFTDIGHPDTKYFLRPDGWGYVNVDDGHQVDTCDKCSARVLALLRGIADAVA